MNRINFTQRLRDAFENSNIIINKNFVLTAGASLHKNQQQTNDAFSEKWHKYEQSAEKERLFQYQRDWYLQLYGFDSEAALSAFLTTKSVIFDAGCGLGYKAAWFAELAPHALVIGMDFSDAARQGAENYRELENLFFIQGDIANTGLCESSIDYTSCDQVIMHTEDPALTFTELARITSKGKGEFACYFYAKKALPRELLDDYFRIQCMRMDRQDLWIMSEQLAELGKRLRELNVSFDCPAIPALGIKKGHYDIQRFIYWNFLKCFWNDELGIETSIMTNFDWYSPSNAKRFNKEDILELLSANKLMEVYFHAEEACFAGRFTHKNF